MKIKIKKALAIKLEEYKVLHGGYEYNYQFKILVSRMIKRDEFKFKKSGSYYYAEKNGFFQIFEHEPGTKDGFAGSTIALNMGSEIKTFEGSLWDPFTVPDDLKVFVCVSITDSEDDFNRGYTFVAGKITKKLFNKIKWVDENGKRKRIKAV